MTIAEPARETAGVEMVSLSIDGHQISVPKGTLLIRAAELMGIQIPRFCDHPLLDPPAGSAWSKWKVSASRWRRAPRRSPPTWWCAPN